MNLFYENIFNRSYVLHPGSYRIRWNNAYKAIMPFKCTDFCTNWKLIYDFLLVININIPPILHRFQDIAFDRSKMAIFCYPSSI